LAEFIGRQKSWSAKLTEENMQLFFSPTSPFARKVRIVIIEKQLTERVQLIDCTPYEDPSELLRTNPLGKIPALALDNGFALFDSPVICEYLESLNPTPRLIPEAGAERWLVLRAQALADGMLDAAVLQVMESRRPEAERSPTAVAHWRVQMLRALAEMDTQLPQIPSALNLGQIAFASGLGYLDLRFPQLNWRATHPALAAWFIEISQRKSLRATEPQ
jgi:glutathione S-transferase